MQPDVFSGDVSPLSNAGNFGESEHASVYEGGRERRSARRKPREQWLSFIPEAHQGNVSWERFEQLRRAIAANSPSPEHPGAARCGQALLAGLLRCHRCGHKLTVRYTGSRHEVLRSTRRGSGPESQAG
jgi:hypothetical protein